MSDSGGTLVLDGSYGNDNAPKRNEATRRSPRPSQGLVIEAVPGDTGPLSRMGLYRLPYAQTTPQVRPYYYGFADGDFDNLRHCFLLSGARAPGVEGIERPVIEGQ